MYTHFSQKILFFLFPLLAILLFFGGWLFFRGQNEKVEETNQSGIEQSSPLLSENVESKEGMSDESEMIDEERGEEKELKSAPDGMNLNMSEWKSYRSEKYGFEFQLPAEYDISDNEKNILKEQNGFLVLDPTKREYRFRSKSGQEILERDSKKGDASDPWEVKLRIHPSSSLAEENFEKWLREVDNSQFFQIGSKSLKNNQFIQFAIRYSIGENSSIFFVRKNGIFELETSENSFVMDDAEDVFSRIANSFQFE